MDGSGLPPLPKLRPRPGLQQQQQQQQQQQKSVAAVSSRSTRKSRAAVAAAAAAAAVVAAAPPPPPPPMPPPLPVATHDVTIRATSTTTKSSNVSLPIVTAKNVASLQDKGPASTEEQVCITRS